MTESGAVWRTARQPRWLALLGLVVVLCVAFGWLGRWQLDVATSKEHPHVSPAAGSTARQPLDQVTQPQQVFRQSMVGTAVTVSGTYQAGQQLLVSGKQQGGAVGFWVLTPLRTASGALVPVVRGFATTAAVGQLGSGEPGSGGRGAFPPPGGTVTVSGSLQPPDPVADPGPQPPAGQIPAADTADLVNRWGGPIYNVLVYAASGAPGSADSAGLAPVPPVDAGGGLGLRNAAYAVQWWLFAAFAVVLWWRMVRQDALDTAARAATHQPAKELAAP